MTRIEFNLDNYRTAPGNRIFSGRDRGEEVRRKMDLDSKEEKGMTIDVVIPEDTFTVNLSFFLGLFSDTVRKRGRDWFENHYTFAGPRVQLDKVPYYTEQAVKDAVPLPPLR